MKLTILVVGCVIALSLTGPAHSVCIDFGASLPGAPTARSTVLTDQLQSLGVSFQTTDPEGVFWWGPDYSWPPARYSIDAGDLGDERSGGYSHSLRFQGKCGPG